jgi:hypothetical protein
MALSAGRLTASLEATGLIRRAQAAGDFAAILHKGDPERGSLLIVVRSRGEHIACLERSLAMDGSYHWAPAGPVEPVQEEKVADFLTKRIGFDRDLWVIELDIAEPERFIAETTSAA